ASSWRDAFPVYSPSPHQGGRRCPRRAFQAKSGHSSPFSFPIGTGHFFTDRFQKLPNLPFFRCGIIGQLELLKLIPLVIDFRIRGPYRESRLSPVLWNKKTPPRLAFSEVGQ